MFAYVSHEGLWFYRHALSSPIWRALASPENAVVLNLAAAVVIAVCLAFVAWRLLFRFSEKPVRWTPCVFGLSFFAVPAFLRHIFDLSPLMFSILPIVLSLVALSLPSHMSRKREDEDDDDDYGRSRGFSVLIAVAGTFAAVAAWESTLGLAFVPVLLIVTLMSSDCGDRSLFDTCSSWMAGFAVGFVLEGLCLGFSWLALKPSLPPMAGLVVFVFICLVPAFVVRKVGENRGVLGVWGLVLAIFGAIAVFGVVGQKESGCEKFVKAVLADLGDRKLVISDGRFDDFLKLLKPDGVRIIGTRTNEDREFLLNYFDDETSVTNRALVVRTYYSLPEMEEAATELGLVRQRLPEKASAKRPAGATAMTSVVMSAEAMKSNVVSRLQKAAEPLFKALTDTEAELAKPASEQNRAVLQRGQVEIRETWRKGVFRGTRLSNALLMTDIMLGDIAALESDAITALMIDRDDPTANGALGAVRQEQGKFEQAERYLRKGVKGGGVFPMGKLAILLLQTDRPDEAVTWARQAVEKSPRDLTLREPLVAALTESGRLDEAERELATLRQMAAEQRATDRERQFTEEVTRRLAELRKEAKHQRNDEK